MTGIPSASSFFFSPFKPPGYLRFSSPPLLSVRQYGVTRVEPFRAASSAAKAEIQAKITHRYTSVVQGFAATMSEQEARELAADARVAFVEPNGVVKATIQNISADVNGKFVTLTPMADGSTPATAGPPSAPLNMGSGLFGWVCGSSGSGTDLTSKYLPGSCRGI